MRRFLFAIVTIVSLSLASYPQAASNDWGNLESLKPGTKIIVVQQSGTETKGRIGRVDDDSVEISRDGKRLQIGRSSIDRVYLTKRGSVWKRALIGAAAGAGIGAGIGVGVTVATKNNGLAAAGGFLIGIPAGAAIGAATTGTKRGRLIYSK